MEQSTAVERIVFIEDPKAAKRYISSERGSAETLIIAMNPSVYVYLREHGKKAVNTLPYISTRSHEMILEKSEELIAWLRDNVKFIDTGIGINNSYSNSFIFYARFIMHYCMWVIEIVLNAINAHSPEVLSAPILMHKSRNLYIQYSENYIRGLVRDMARTHSLKFTDICHKETYEGGFVKGALERARFLAKLIDFYLWLNQPAPPP